MFEGHAASVLLLDNARNIEYLSTFEYMRLVLTLMTTSMVIPILEKLIDNDESFEYLDIEAPLICQPKIYKDL